MQPEIVEQITKLAESDYEVKRLWDEHQQLDAQIAEMSDKKYLTPEQEFAMRELQKQKLLGKDKLFERLRLASAS